MSIINLSAEDQRRTVDVHHDFEFVDDGVVLRPISFGAVIEGAKGVKHLYGINSDFFRTDKFKEMCAADRDDEQVEWMFDNVFASINLRVSGDPAKSAKALRKIIGAAKHNDIEVVAADQKIKGAGKASVVVGNLPALRKKLIDVVESVCAEPSKIDVRQWCYYAAHDTVCLNNVFGGMLEKPEGWSHYAVDIRLLSEFLGLNHDDYNPEAKVPHHPYFDALAQYQTAQKLLQYARNVPALALVKKMRAHG